MLVLMCGTNDLDSQSWKENFQQLLHRCQYLFPQVPTYAIALLPWCDGLRHLVPQITIAMGEVCAEFPSYVVLLDFSKEFSISDTFLCALNDPVHLSDVLAQRKFFAEEQQARLERGLPASLFLPEHIWQKI